MNHLVTEEWTHWRANSQDLSQTCEMSHLHSTPLMLTHGPHHWERRNTLSTQCQRCISIYLWPLKLQAWHWTTVVGRLLLFPDLFIKPLFKKYTSFSQKGILNKLKCLVSAFYLPHLRDLKTCQAKGSSTVFKANMKRKKQYTYR